MTSAHPARLILALLAAAVLAVAAGCATRQVSPVYQEAWRVHDGKQSVEYK